MTPAGTSNELDVHNEWEENTHTHTHIKQAEHLNRSLQSASMRFGLFYLNFSGVEAPFRGLESKLCSVSKSHCPAPPTEFSQGVNYMQQSISVFLSFSRIANPSQLRCQMKSRRHVPTLFRVYSPRSCPLTRGVVFDSRVWPDLRYRAELQAPVPLAQEGNPKDRARTFELSNQLQFSVVAMLPTHQVLVLPFTYHIRKIIFRAITYYVTWLKHTTTPFRSLFELFLNVLGSPPWQSLVFAGALIQGVPFFSLVRAWCVLCLRGARSFVVGDESWATPYPDACLETPWPHVSCPLNLVRRIVVVKSER